MTDDINLIRKAISYEVISAMGDEGLEALLTVDDLLACMAVPATQFDFTYVDRGTLKKLMIEVEHFVKYSRLRVSSYTKAGLQAKLEDLWIPTLSEEKKRELVSEYLLIDGFDDEGYAIFNEETYKKWKDIFDRGQIPTLKYKTPHFNSQSIYMEMVEGRPFVSYKNTLVDGYWCAPLEITPIEWERVIKGASSNIKRMLQCYRQLDVPNKRMDLLSMEKKFGITWESLNSCNTALGRRAQRMLNFAVMDADDDTRRRYWSTAMTKGRGENGQWVWEPRPELMEAAEIVLSEENFPKVPEME